MYRLSRGILLDSSIDGDKNNTFFEKCLNKSPTMIFVKTTDNLRFGGFTNALWPKSEYASDENSFLFSLDNKKKYKIKKKKKEKAIYYSKDSCFCFGCGCDLYINNNCTKKEDNEVGNGAYELQSKYELNNGKQYFKVLSYEVYQIE